MKRLGYRGGLAFTTAALTTGAMAGQDLGPHPWQVEAGAFFPQENVKSLIGDSSFYVAVLKDVSRHTQGAVTSLGASWIEQTDNGNQVRSVGLFVRQTWYGEMDEGGYGGPFFGFDVGIFGSRVRTAATSGGGGNNGGGTPGTSDDQIGLGAGAFLGFQFGERVSIRGGYNFYPPADATSIHGFYATVGYRF